MIRVELQKELQELAEQICRKENKEIPIIHLKHNRRGYTNYSGYISIPIWAISEGREYLNYYLIHELIHWLICRGHCEVFKNKENEILNRYGLEPIYSKVYIKVLLKNGKEVWNKKTSKIFNRA